MHLNPCPACGEAGYLAMSSVLGCWFVECSHCKLRAPDYSSEAEAANVWNRIVMPRSTIETHLGKGACIGCFLAIGACRGGKYCLADGTHRHVPISITEPAPKWCRLRKCPVVICALREPQSA